MKNSMLLLQYKAMDRKIDPNQPEFMDNMWYHIPNYFILLDDVIYDQIRILPKFSSENLMAKNSILYYRIPFTCGPVTVACIHHPLVRITANLEIKAINDESWRFVALIDEVLAALRNYERGNWNGTTVIENTLINEADDQFDACHQSAWLELYRNAEKG